ncbi:MAG: chorismate lyase, partial [Halothiobacillaceae bacterium]
MEPKCPKAMPSSSPIKHKPTTWLNAPGSLTRHLQRACAGRLTVHVLSEGWVRAETVAAQGLLVRAGVRIWQREVMLHCHQRDYVHALTWVTAQ